MTTGTRSDSRTVALRYSGGAVRRKPLRGALRRIRRKLRRAWKRKWKQAVIEFLASAAVGLGIGCMFIWAFVNDTSYEYEMPEHYNQVYYCGIWWDIDDYNAMMEEREAYYAAEAEEEAYWAELFASIEAEDETYESIIGSLDWGAEDSEILLQVAMAEAESEGVEGMALVMLVVLNRVWSDDFPDTISAVVFEDGQFSVVEDGNRYWTVTPNEECYEALELVMSGWDESQGATYFESTTNESTWHKDNLTFLFQYGNHLFYTEG